MTDRELLQRYLADHSEAAFRELVQRHLPMVHAAALRRANGDAHLANDIAQRAFVALFTKAKSLQNRDNLAGWLHTAAGFEAGRLVRSEVRRRKREEVVNTMDSSKAASDSSEAWNRLVPAIDGAVGELPEKDREGVVLRFFSGKSYAEIGAIVGATEDTARKRIERALEKLRDILKRRGIESTAGVLGTALEAHGAATAGSSAHVALADSIWRDVTFTAARTGIVIGANTAILGVASLAAIVTSAVILTDVVRLRAAQTEEIALEAEAATATRNTDTLREALHKDRAQPQAKARQNPGTNSDLASANAEVQREHQHLLNQRFYRKLQLNAAQIDAFEQATAKHRSTALSVMDAVRAGTPPPLSTMKEATAEWKDTVKAALGPNGFDAYAEFQKTANFYTYLDQVDASLPPGAPAISTDQADRVAAVAEAHSAQFQSGHADLNPRTVDWDAAYPELSAVLASSQLSVLKAYVDRDNAQSALRQANPGNLQWGIPQ